MEYSGKPTADIWQRQEWTRRARERKTDLLVILSDRLRVLYQPPYGA